MNARFGLTVGAAIAAFIALILAVAPTSWMQDLLEVSGADATAFLLRRYGASATAALLVATVAIALGATPARAILRALAAWFAAQGAVAIWGLITGVAGGLAWLAVFADPVIATWFLLLSARADSEVSADLKSRSAR